MPRPPRLDPPDTWHHITNRGARRQQVFIDDCDREDFVALLRELDRRFGVEVHLYCLVGNHFHLVVRSRDGRVSDAMKFLSQRFTRHSNDRHGFDGAIFRGRFNNVIVTDDDHHRWLFGYVNGKNARDSGWRGPIDRYPWSSLANYVEAFASTVPDRWLHTSFYAGLFANDVTRMLDFVNDGAQEVSSNATVGSRTQTADRERVSTTASGTKSALHDTHLSAVVDAVVSEWNCGPESLGTSAGGRCNEPRLASILIAVDVFACPTHHVADCFGLASAAGCRVLLGRARQRRASDARFAAAVARASLSARPAAA